MQLHTEVHRPPRVRLQLGMRTGPALHVCVTTAVVRVTGVAVDIKPILLDADLVGRTIESDVHIEASFRRCCASPLRYVITHLLRTESTAQRIM